MSAFDWVALPAVMLASFVLGRVNWRGAGSGKSAKQVRRDSTNASKKPVGATTGQNI